MNGLIFQTLCASFLISSKFSAIVAAYRKHLSSSFFDNFSFLYSMENEYMNQYAKNLFYCIRNGIKDKTTSSHLSF